MNKVPEALKKIFSILLLAIFLFNVGGYYAIFWGLRYQAKQELVSRLDSDNYANDETILIRIPITLPYPMPVGYERVNGEFEHNGEFFKLVKQKLENDTLNIVCIKDHKERQLFGAFKDFIKLSNDLPTTDSQHAVILLSKLLKDYEPLLDLKVISCEGWVQESSTVDRNAALLSQDRPVLSPPPKRILS